MHVSKINMSSTYKHIMTRSPFPDLAYTHLSTSLVEYLSKSKTLSSFSRHFFGVYLSLYKNLKCLHTLFS